ncbi:MAG: hypothetical protein RLY14_1479, partial [Planctomycetota bacterium]
LMHNAYRPHHTLFFLAIFLHTPHGPRLFFASTVSHGVLRLSRFCALEKCQICKPEFLCDTGDLWRDRLTHPTWLSRICALEKYLMHNAYRPHHTLFFLAIFLHTPTWSKVLLCVDRIARCVASIAVLRVGEMPDL